MSSITIPSSPSGTFVRMRDGGATTGLVSGTPPPTLTQRVTKGVHKGLKKLSKVKFPFKAPSLIDRSRPYFSGIKRFGVPRMFALWHDPFHTLLNLPWWRFILTFFATYIIEFMLFAFVYWAMTDTCIDGLENKFSHALWLSSRTASTLGFNDIKPNPDCSFTNFCIMLQVIASSLVNFIMLGVVFARFSAPFKRASTVRFSKQAVVHCHSSGYWCIALRVANLRKHQILRPSVRMVVTAVDSIMPSNYMFEHLEVEGAYQQETNLELGFPANLVHVVRPGSYLYNLSLLEMDTRMMEVLVFLDGIDAMTSKHISARFAYPTSDILFNQVFVPMTLEMRGRSLGLDFSDFDNTTTAWPALEAEVEAEGVTRDVRGGGLWQLRHMTFKRLAERYSHAAPPAPMPLSASTSDVAAGAAGHDTDGGAYHDHANNNSNGGVHNLRSKSGDGLGLSGAAAAAVANGGVPPFLSGLPRANSGGKPLSMVAGVATGSGSHRGSPGQGSPNASYGGAGLLNRSSRGGAFGAGNQYTAPRAAGPFTLESYERSPLADATPAFTHSDLSTEMADFGGGHVPSSKHLLDPSVAGLAPYATRPGSAGGFDMPGSSSSGGGSHGDVFVGRSHSSNTPLPTSTAAVEPERQQQQQQQQRSF